MKLQPTILRAVVALAALGVLTYFAFHGYMFAGYVAIAVASALLAYVLPASVVHEVLEQLARIETKVTGASLVTSIAEEVVPQSADATKTAAGIVASSTSELGKPAAALGTSDGSTFLDSVKRDILIESAKRGETIGNAQELLAEHAAREIAARIGIAIPSGRPLVTGADIPIMTNDEPSLVERLAAKAKGTP